MKRYLLLISLLCTGGLLQAAVFSSTDGRFTMELPSGWSVARKPAVGSVLSVVKGSARIDIKAFAQCHTEDCIEKKTQQDLLDVKNKKMQIIGNTYTGEEIKRIDFSTGEPFFYISFFTSKNDFSSGYFLIGQQAYSILAKDLSYAQTDLLFSFISPAQTPTTSSNINSVLEIDTTDSRAYDIEPTPAVMEENIALDTPVQEPTSSSLATPATRKSLSESFAARTLITGNMPPYIKQLGHGFDVLIFLLFVYLLVQMGAFIVRLFIKPYENTDQVNPNSPYPIKFRRLYGTPSLIFRAQDNQGNILISLSGRWDSLFLFGGIMLIIGAGLVMAITGILEITKLVPLSAFTYNAIYSAISLIIPFGFVIFICGILWTQLILRQFTLYDNKGQKAVYVMQRGFGLNKERYVAYFVKSKEILILEKKRFAWMRSWTLLDKQQHVLAQIQEDSVVRAIFRRITGHLWGLLRASYTIHGPMESTGQISNARTLFNRFSCQIDKPQALSARDLLVTALIINIRDRDKWYPWF